MIVEEMFISTKHNFTYSRNSRYCSLTMNFDIKI